ncbi:hypothetical protein [Alteribacillus bidgolensis]|uniref:Uncharacterized protein n=1 Tax=Alteribacillus bidgolensis TaxID=930129 RepID=A0A1G8JK84_9BACI|nr:hypothetical protein [Alteribacillus bidgolensis]SDI31473.1 hypothetical protein SAMN05216352_106225 [Alteribacillus bidgolensis]
MEWTLYSRGEKNKEEYRKDWLQDNLIVYHVPDSLILSSKGIVIELNEKTALRLL